MTVLVPPGLPLPDAARWVGGSCWLELRVHELITEVLSDERLDDEVRVVLWGVRSNRAEVAEAWHRRLPELRELPRETFVVEPADPLDDHLGSVAGIGDGYEVASVVEWLARLEGRYRAHADVAVGPADGPVAATLRWARGLLAHDLAELAVDG